MEVKSHRDLIVWQRAMEQNDEIYRLAELLPKKETYDLGSQMRRASCSVPLNIAEGWGRATTKEFLNFLSIANGSNCEINTQLEICKRTRMIAADDLEKAFALIRK